MIYEDNFKNYSSYNYDPKVNFEDLKNLNTPTGMNEGYLNDFEYSLRKGKIKILRSSYIGWFGGNNSKADLDYTFKQYWKKMIELLKDENYRNTIERRRGFFNNANEKEINKDQGIVDKISQQEREKAAQQEREKDQQEREKAQQEREKAQQEREKDQQIKEDFIKSENIFDIKSRNYSFFKILNDYEIENTDDFALAHLKSSKNWDEKQFMEYLVRKLKDYYNAENMKFTDFVNRYNTLSLREKNLVKNIEKSLNGILKVLKPLLNLYDPAIIRLNQELDKMEKTMPEKLKNYNLPVENLRKVNLRINETQEKIEDLKTKIINVKEKINSAKSDRNKNVAQKKSELRVSLIKYENEMEKIQNRIKELQKIKDNYEDNFSSINDEKLYRLAELDAIRNINEKKIREKIALSKSSKLENLLSEIKSEEAKIQELNEKIIDTQDRYAANVGKLRVVEFKLEKLKKLQNRKTELEEKLRQKNLSIQERQNLLKEKTGLNEKLVNIENLKDQVADLKSKIPSSSVFEQEKILREREIRKLKNLNNSSIREKNALLKSIELEKIKTEIAVREERRYQQEQREKEELKQAKIVFLKEKKIAERRIDELKVSKKLRNEQITKMKILEQDYLSQKKFLEEIKAMQESKLKEKKLQIEQKKLQTLEIEKQNLEKNQDYTDQQKLFADSIQRDIDDLNDQKNILQNIKLQNEKILKNTKDELKTRQTEIEKTINLNIASIKQKEADILSEEAKIKLDVFSTLENLKDQTAKKLEDLKEEIIRKQDVSDLLNETVEKISNTEISEVEEYNSFLESEIAFKKKLAKENLNLAEYKKTIAEEKEDLIERLEHVKSQKLKKIYQLREKAIESQMKIILLEGSEDLKNNLFSLKYEIENLEKEKEISERKEDLMKFQSDNYKRELNLRNQEIELLKNLRLKVLQKERLDLRNQASQEIIDTVKKIEAKEKQDVREKLDEIIDDVETKEISRKSKAALFSIIDKIEDKENKDVVKEKINFILGKIELHDNIEESRKKLDEFFKNKQIQKDVQEKLDEILDDIEFDDDDYDFLDEEDEFYKFLSSVKNHISGEKKMEQFSKIDAILEEEKKADSKLKMDENIEMKNLKPAPDEVGEGSGETSFDEFSDYNFFINTIEDPLLRKKTRTFLGDIDGFEKEQEKEIKIKNAYKSAINSALWDDQLDLDYWDGNIILDERAKFDYEQKVNNINTALVDYDIHIDPKDQRVREFIEIKLTQTTSEKRGEINGYLYNGEKIISRNISRNFFFNYIKKPGTCQKFIDELKGVINKTAKSQIANESKFEGESVKHCALEYIGELREEQSYQIDSARNGKEMRNALRDANDIDKEIKNIKKNLPFKMRIKIFRRTLSWRFTKLLRLLWKHKGKTSVFVFTVFSAIIGVVLNQFGVIAVIHNLKKAARSVKQYANDVHEMGKRIIHNIQSIYRVPGQILGWTLIGLAFFLKLLYFFTRMSGTAGSAWIFGIFGSVLEISLYFSGNVENINEKAVEVIEETGNIIENAGIRSQKYIAKNMPRWYYDKPVEERTVLQHIEAGAANIIFKVAKGTEYTGKKVQDAGEVMKNSLWYMQAFLIVGFSLLVLIFIRNYIL